MSKARVGEVQPIFHGRGIHKADDYDPSLPLPCGCETTDECAEGPKPGFIYDITLMPNRHREMTQDEKARFDGETNG